jgi:uncharacterized membrane protein
MNHQQSFFADRTNRKQNTAGRKLRRMTGAVAIPLAVALLAVALLLLLGRTAQAANGTGAAEAAGAAGEAGAATAPEEVQRGQAAIFYVTDSGSGEECTQAEPCSLQTATDLANDGDEIHVAAGLYNDIFSGGGFTQTVLLDSSVWLRGGYDAADWEAEPDPEANDTILDGQDQGRVIRIVGAVSPIIEGFHIRNGLSAQGSGIFNPSGSPTIRDNEIYENASTGVAPGSGAGIYASAAAVIVDNEIHHNTAASGGGGIVAQNDGITPTLIAYNRIHDNTAGSTGGGISIAAGNIQINANAIYLNTATFGGGIVLQSAVDLVIQNNMIYGNKATSTGAAGAGGGLAIQGAGSTHYLWNNTFVANEATGASNKGGAMAIFGGGLEIRNTIIVSNVANTLGGIYHAPGSVITGTHNNFFGNTSDVTLPNTINLPPQFVNYGAFDLHLSAASPNVNSGDLTVPVTEDYDGQGRPFDGGIDIGADEFYDPANQCFVRLNNGGVYDNIQEVVNLSTVPTDTVKVAGRCTGSGSQVVLLDSTLTLQGGYTVTDWANPTYGAAVIDAQNAGGRRGIVVSAGSPTIDSVRVTGGNLAAGNGSGIYVQSSGTTVRNVVLHGNAAPADGGALGVAVGVTGNFFFNTIANNNADGANFEIGGSIHNSIFYNNSGDEISGGSGHSFNLIDANPLFVNAGAGNFHIGAASPALDAANPAATLDHDFDGAARPAGNGFDAGADEANEYPAFLFEPSLIDREVPRGTVYTFTHVLSNTGTMPDTYNLIHTNSNGWAVDYPTPINLNPGEHTTVLVAVDVPADAQATDLATTWVTATSSINDNVQATVVDIANVLPIPGLMMTPSYSNTVLPGTTITYTHWLTNSGDFTDTVTVAIVNDLFDWAEFVPEGTITQVVLPSGDSWTFQVSVEVAPKAAAGLINPVVIQATSSLSPAITAVVTDTVVAKATVGTRYVRTNGTDTNNNCTQPNDPCLTLARAIGQASLEDAIRVTQGTYHESDINVNSTVFVSGGWLLNFSQQTGAPTIIDGDGVNRILNIAPGSGVQPSFDNLTLYNGSTSAVGGAIWVQTDAQPRFTRLTIEQSSSSQGGAIYLSTGTSVVISQTAFISNTSSRSGGAIYQNGGTLLLVQSRFEGNEANGTLAGQGGGAVFVEAGTLQAWSNLFNQNTAALDGGALFTRAGIANLLHNTYNDNTAGNRGGAVYNSGAIVAVRSSILSHNNAANGDGVYQSSGVTTMDYNDYWNNSSNVAEGPNSTQQDPLYDDADFRLSSLSPAVDTADPNSPINRDFEDDPRPVDQGFDMGWDELAGCLAERNDIIYGGIQDAIDAGGPEMLIRVSGHCRGVHPITAGSDTISQTVHLFDQPEALTIQGGWNSTFDNDLAVQLFPTLVDPLERGRGFYLDSSIIITIENITVINGDAAGLGGGPAGQDAGGGVFLEGGNAAFRNLGVRNSEAVLGGGLYNEDAIITLLPFETSSTITTVITHTNGITEVVTNTNHLVRTNEFAFNIASDGGALYNQIGQVWIESGYMHGNQASSDGGGFFNNLGLLQASNVIFANNQAAANGGAIYNQSSASPLLHLTVYSNTAALGGGIYSAGGTPQIRNSIFQGNQAGTGRSVYISGGAASIDYNYYHPQAANHVFGGILGVNSLHSNTPPGLVNPTAGDFHLADGGPAADRADPDSPIEVDFELQVRPVNQGWDMGADEVGNCLARVRSSGLIFGSIQVAISNSAGTGDWVDVAGVCSGVHQYSSGSMGVISQTVHLDVNVNLQGGWNMQFTAINTSTVLNAADLGRVLYVAPGITSTVRGFTMTGGSGAADGLNGNGGAIYLDNAQAFIEDNVIYDNSATNGAAVYINGGTPTIWYGNRIHTNNATAAGGAFYVASGTPLIANNFVYLNTATNGGGFASAGGNANFWHNTLIDNSVIGNGGGIHVSAGTPSIRSNIVMENAAAAGGGGAYGTGGTPSLGYNDFFDNAPTNFGGTIGNGGTGSISVNPSFTNPGAYNLTITSTSPVLDRADPTLPLLVDFEDDIRPSHQGWDMGADEVGGCYAMIVRTGEIYGSIQRAADLADDGDTILVDGRCINVNGRIASAVNVSQTLFLNKDLTIDGDWNSGFLPGNTPAVLDPLSRGRAVFIDSGVNVTLTNLTLVKGNASITGLSNGGGVYNSGWLSMTNMSIHDNIAANGGGFYNDTDSQAYLYHNKIATNTVTTAGGGVHNESGVLLLDSNEIFNNHGHNGAGVYLNSGSGTAVSVINNFIFRNESVNSGGGLYNANTNASIWHNTFVFNNAFGGNGGGILSAGGLPAIRNNIVDTGTGTGIHASGGLPSIAYNNVVDYSGGNYGGSATPGVGAISESPDYVPGNDNYHLDDDSPGVDVGDPASPIDYDYDGHIRPTNGGWDMGADEVNSCLVRVVDPDEIGTRIFGVLQDAIDYAELNNFTLVEIARGECRGVKERNGTFQVGYVSENLEFVGSLRRLNFTDPQDYANPEVGTLTSIINAENEGRVIYIDSSASPTFLHLVFINGNGFAGGGTNSNGGAIYNAGNAQFTESFISQSNAQNGGGYYGTLGTSVELRSNSDTEHLLPLTGVDLREPEGEIYGQGRIGAALAARIVESVNGGIEDITFLFFEGNSAVADGGGIFNNGDLYITGMALEDNHAGGRGGGAFNQGSQFEAINNGFYYNEATGDGGGFYNTNRPVRVINLIFLGNVTSQDGGGIYNQGDLEVYHNTIYHNRSVGDGAGIYHEGPSLTLNSSIVYTNVASGTVGGLRALSGNLDYNNFFQNVPNNATIPLGTHSISAQPLFSFLWFLDYRSPDVDKADPALLGAPLSITYDWENDIRPDGGTDHEGVRLGDIGADEWWKDFGCLVVPVAEEISAGPGEVITYNMAIINTGYPPDTYPHGFTDTITITLESSSQNWATLEGEGSPTLGWFESALVTVTVSVPPNTSADLEEITKVKCQSHSMPERSHIGQTILTVATARAVIVAPDYVDFAYPNDVLTYTHTITNLGNVSDTYKVTANSGPAFASAAIVNPDGTLPLSDTVTLLPGQSTDVLLRVHILPDARSGEVATPGVVARSTEEVTVFDAALNQIEIGYIQGTRYVAAAGGSNTTNNCTVLENPCATIQHAVDQALDGDSVLVAVGTYTDVITSTIGSHTLFVNKSITITGGYDAADGFTTVRPITNAVVLDGEGVQRVVYVETGVTVSLSALFIQNGLATPAPAAFEPLSGTLEAQAMVFVPTGGGGLYNAGADLTLDGVWVQGNEAEFGGGVYHEAGSLHLHSSVLASNNVTGTGGGLYVTGGAVLVENNTLADNSSAGAGGAIHQAAGSLVITNSIFYDNDASSNSALFAQPDTVADYNLFYLNPEPASNVPTGTHSIAADPLFGDAYYHITEFSPARDTGTNEVSGGFDFDYEPRKQGLSAEIGADEWLQLPAFEFEPAFQTALIDEGDVYTYTHTITNTGDFTDTYALEASHQNNGGTGWDYSFSPTLISDLPVSGTATVTFVITGGSPGYQDTTIITATSISQPNTPLSHSVTDVTQITQIPGVDIDPSRNGSGEPGEVIHYNHTLTNTGNGPDSYTLAVASNVPPDWSVTINPAVTGQVLPGATTPFTVSVTIPATATVGLVNTAVITAASNVDPSTTDSLTDITTVEPVYGLSLVPDHDQTAAAGTTVVYTHTLSSESNASDVATLTFSTNPNWTVDVSPGVVNLPPFGSTTVYVSVTVPANAGGVTNVTHITATSTISPNLTAAATNTTTVPSEAGVLIEPDYFRVVTPGVVVTYSHTLTNTGNLEDTFNLGVVSSLGWFSQVSPGSVSLLPGATAAVVVTVTVPGAAQPGMENVTTVTAVSTVDPAVQDTAVDRTRITQEHGLLFEPDLTQNAQPNTVVTYTHTLTNTGDGEDTFGFTAVSENGWVTTVPTSVTLGSGASAPVQVTIAVPAGTSGIIDEMTVTAFSVISPTTNASVLDTTIVGETGGPADIIIEPDNSLHALAGETVVYYHTMTNTGGTADTFNLSTVSSQGWLHTIAPTSAQLDPGESAQVIVQVTVPVGTPGGVSDTLTVTVTAASDPGITDLATDTTIVDTDAFARVRIEPDQSASALQGTTVVYTHTVMNLGNQQDTISLAESSVPLWPTDLSQNSITLLAGQIGTIQLSVDVPSSAAPGTVNTTIIFAVSGNDINASDTATDTTTALQAPVSPVYLPIIRKDVTVVPPPGTATPTPSATATTPPGATSTPTPPATATPTVGSCVLVPPGQANPVGIDLIVTNITITPNQPVAGQPVTLAVTIKNQGQTGVPAGNNFYLDFYDNPNPEPPHLYQWGNVAWGAQGVDMGPGASKTYYAQYVFSGGAHRVYAQVDTDSTVGEANEGNNLYGCLAVNVAGATGSEAAETTPVPTAVAPRHTPTSEAVLVPAVPGPVEAESTPVPTP